MADAYIEKGTTYEIDGKVYECLEFLHVKPGKGSAFVRTKLKDVINGGVVERTFNPSKDVLKKAFIERKTMQYSYVDGNLYYFMDNETFEQIPVDSEGVKGNTATGATKPAIVETGAQVMVPLFVNEGEVIKIDTRSGEYLSRA